MKKLLSLLLTITLSLSLTACGTNETNSENNTENTSSQTTETVEESSVNSEWKQFLKDYEEWVDKYIEITEKYKSNPSDLSILGSYTEMMTELAEWSTKTEEIKKDLEQASSVELIQYSAELAKIVAKLAKASN